MDQTAVQNRTMRDYVELMNKMVDHCFDNCISNFNQYKATDGEMKCVNTCADKSILYNQRHMMVFVEHNQTRQKQAMKAAEAQTVASAAQEATALPTAATNSEQEAVTPVPEATTLAQNKETVVEETSVKNVNGLPEHSVLRQFAVMQSGMGATYTGKSVVDQYLENNYDELKFV